MSSVEVTVAMLKEAFPEFNVEAYSDAVLNRYILMAEAYCSTRNWRIRPAVRILLIELMAAHLITLAGLDPVTGIVKGSASATGFETSASVGGVSVSLQAPIARNAFEQWINSTGYGQQYWALLVANVPTPVHYIGTPRAFGIR